MKNFLKLILVLVFILCLVGVISVLCLVSLVDPNRFKPLLVEQAKKYTQHEVRLEGDLSWKLFPEVAISVNHVAILDKSGLSSKPLLDIGHLDLALKLVPLLQGKLEIIGLDMKAVSAYFAAGAIHNATLHATNIRLNDYFPLTLHFDYLDKKNPTLTTEVAASAAAFFNTAQQVYLFRDLKGEVQLHQKKQKLKIKWRGKLKVDMAHDTLSASDLNCQLANLELKGSLHISKLLKAPVTVAHFSTNSFDLKAALSALGQNTEDLEFAQNARGEFDYAASDHGVSLKGKTSLEALSINHLQLTHLSAQPQFQLGLLDWGVISADFYQGKLLSKAVIDFKGQQPTLQLTANLHQVELAALLQDLAAKKPALSLSGKSDIQLQLKSLLDDSQTFIRNLNGSGHFAIQNGIIQGMDVDNLIDTAYALIKNQTRSSIDTNTTHFNMLSGTVLIRGGVIQNHDLLLDGLRFATKGEGAVDLPNKRMTYLLQTTIKKKTPEQKDDLDNLYGLAIPVTINGALDHPVIRLDSIRLLKEVALMQLKRSGASVSDQLKGQIPANTGDLLQMLINH